MSIYSIPAMVRALDLTGTAGPAHPGELASSAVMQSVSRVWLNRNILTVRLGPGTPWYVE